MAKKRMTLPDNFSEILGRNDLGELQAVFEKCDINAYERGSNKTPALCYYGISVEFIEWLVQHGADIEAKNGYGRTALYRHSEVNRVEKVGKLLELGADIHTKDNYGNTVLHGAGHGVETVRLLLEKGADPLVRNAMGYTPLQGMLARCRNADISRAVQVAELLLQAGDKVSEFAQEQVFRIGKDFEFHRGSFNPDYLEETDRALQRLYVLFGVAPVPRRRVYDGTSPITVAAESWQAQFDELWDLLVPASGNANTVQGEVIRICGKISHEILDNGAVNWGRGYAKLPQALPAYFAMGNSKAGEELETLAKSIGADSDEESLDRLCELAVKWVLANPNPIPLARVPYDR